MAKDMWLPKGYELDSGLKISSLIFSGDDWQILDTNGSVNVLLALPALAKKWSDAGFLDNHIISQVNLGAATFYSLNSNKRYLLAPVESGETPSSKIDAIAFALALKESRKISYEASFHDAIYIEQFSRLLPTWSVTPRVEDEVVLGSWMSGGVAISTDSFRRLTSLTGWMPAADLAEIIRAAGFHVAADASFLSRKKWSSPACADAEITIVEPALSSVGASPVLDEAEQKTFSLPGRPLLEKFFNEHVIDIIFNAEKYQAMGIEFQPVNFRYQTDWQ